MEKLIKILLKLNKRNKFRNKRRFRRKNRGGLRKIDYQFLPKPQSMGPGATAKNFERLVTIDPAANIRQMLYSLIGDDDFYTCCRSYRYAKIIGVCITQNSINLTNEQDNVYVRIAWSENYEEIEDIDKDDCSKILPNIGRKRFMFRPPNAQLTLYINRKTINPRMWMATEHFYNSTEDEYRIPGSIEFYNTTTLSRKVRVTLRMIFRGNKVLDKVEEAKRILKKFKNEEGREAKEKKNDEINKEEDEKEEDVDEVELEKWSYKEE